MKAASKWIRNYLIGKKEEKYKIDTDSTKYKIESPKVKRKWSFGRIKSKAAVHKFSRSFDSVDSTKLQIQSVEVETQVFNSVSKTQHIEIAAATRVQAAFRSYLARKALHALRGLVKLQALVRGHLVRKRTTAILRGMHALMAIQVRARIHRIRTAEEANLLVANQSSQHRQIPRDEVLIRENKDTSLREMQRVIKSRSGPLDRSHVKSTEHGSMTFYSNRKYQYKENTLITEPSSAGNTALSELNPTKAISTCQRRSVSWAPNYMTKTESSRAKARSQSEPKQRPKLSMRQKNKYLSSGSSRFNHGNLDHWAINYRGSLTDSKSDSFRSSMATSDSYH